VGVYNVRTPGRTKPKERENPVSRLLASVPDFDDPLIKPGEGIFSMAKKLYVGNLSYNTTEDGLRNLFADFGNVASAKIVFDRETGNSKGFGFIEMSTDEEASAAIAGTNGREFDGRQLRVNEAMDKPRRDRNAGGYGGGNW
jgi:RNA recognition motif-containing protein